MNHTEFTQLSFYDKIKDWEYISINKSHGSAWIRLFYHSNGDDNGFDFYAIEDIGFDDSDDIDATTCSEVLVYGTAYWDGMRHLYFGDEETDNYGYLYYPQVNEVINILTEVRKLELRYCRKEELAIYEHETRKGKINNLLED